MNKPIRSSVRLLSRRNFCRNLVRSYALLGLPGLAQVLPVSDYPFEQILPAMSGINWVHSSGKSAEKLLPETTGAGCAFLDYDNDGWMDIYLVNSGSCDFFRPAQPLRNALYRNNRDGSFTDVTDKAGVAAGGYGRGVAVGDYDNDGFPDIYVTQYGRSILYHNNGDGSFTDVTEKAGVGAPGWATSAVWFDYDNDGRLDLYVCQFAIFDTKLNKLCKNLAEGVQGYCSPRIFQPTPSWLFHNNGDGTFTDVSRESGIQSCQGKAWGAVAVDINNDGWMDLFVANDTVRNFLFVNRGGGRFEELGELAGVAYSPDGRARSGMGVDAADVNEDGWVDLFVTNLDLELFSLYRNNHDETFDDVARTTGVSLPTRLMSGWGLKFFDFDNDGTLDLLIANGNPDDLVESLNPQVKYQEPLKLFRGGDQGFMDISAQSGPVFARPYSARGLAIGDFNNDGRVDVLVSVNDAAPLLLKNTAGKQNHWLGIHLVGTTSNRDAVGARITYSAGDLRNSRIKVGGSSYLSSHDPRVVLGIGKRSRIDWLEVTWPPPSNLKERFTTLPIDRYITIVENSGKWK